MKGIEERDEAEIATFTSEELREYEDSLKAYRDIKNSIDTVRVNLSHHPTRSMILNRDNFLFLQACGF